MVAGLAAANEAHPALVITDRSMPGMDDIEFCRQLRLEPKLARIPVVPTSTNDEIALGAPIWDEFWQKAVSVETMLTSIWRLAALPS